MKILSAAAALLALAFVTITSPAPAKSSCSASCDREAASCNDACEAQHQDAKPRIECKLACIEKRGACEKGCS